MVLDSDLFIVLNLSLDWTFFADSSWICDMGFCQNVILFAPCDLIAGFLGFLNLFVIGIRKGGQKVFIYFLIGLDFFAQSFILFYGSSPP